MDFDQDVLELRLRAPSISESEAEHRGHSTIGWADDPRGLVTAAARVSPGTSLAEIANVFRSKMATGRQIHCPRQKPTQHDPGVPRGAAFAYARMHRHDIRPDLLTLAGAQRANDAGRVLEYCRNYLQVTCDRRRLLASAELQGAIALDALRVWLFQAKSPSQGERAKKLTMRKADYGSLHAIVFDMLVRRYAEASARYTAGIEAGTENQGTSVKLNSGVKKITAPAQSHVPAAKTAALPSHVFPILHLGINHEKRPPTGAMLHSG